MRLVNTYLAQNPCYAANMRGADDRYTIFQRRGPQGFVLHSVGCAQPSAETFARRWNASSCQVCVHAFIDAETQVVHQTLPWNFRGWHCGGSANNTHVGVEMCEPKWLQYKGKMDRFTVPTEHLEQARAQVCRSYAAAVELVAYLAGIYGWDVTKPGVILSHAEAGKRGLASGHSDPEHLWTQLGLPYTMDTFRRDVAEALGVTAQPDCAKEDIDMETLRRGSSGKQVQVLQALLNLWGGYKLSADGAFGGMTFAAVKDFQRRHGLTADGVVGPKTWGKLLATR